MFYHLWSFETGTARKKPRISAHVRTVPDPTYSTEKSDADQIGNRKERIAGCIASAAPVAQRQTTLAPPTRNTPQDENSPSYTQLTSWLVSRSPSSMYHTPDPPPPLLESYRKSPIRQYPVACACIPLAQDRGRLLLLRPQKCVLSSRASVPASILPRLFLPQQALRPLPLVGYPCGCSSLSFRNAFICTTVGPRHANAREQRLVGKKVAPNGALMSQCSESHGGKRSSPFTFVHATGRYAFLARIVMEAKSLPAESPPSFLRTGTGRGVGIRVCESWLKVKPAKLGAATPPELRTGCEQRHGL